MKKIGVLVVGLMLAVGCKSLKTITPTASIDSSLRPKRIQQQIETTALSFETLQWRGQATFDHGGKRQKISLTTRLKQQEGIWLNGSVIVPLARVFITPNSLQFYEKINRQYATMDYKEVETLLGVALDYTTLENILTAKPVVPRALKRAKLSFTNDAYVFSYHRKGIILQFVFDATFRLVEQRLKSDETTLSVVYDNYKKIDGQWVPEQLRASFFGKTPTILTLQTKQTQLNSPVKMPFSIPEGYKPIPLP
ncbi:MAG: DUF4292 domain-containing protein [Flavobacteriaceae bacterium]